MRFLLAAFLLCLSLSAPALAQDAEPAPAPAPAAEAATPPVEKTTPARQMEDTGFVVLRTIDKLSARTHTFEIPVEKTVKFGRSLFIKARACRKSSPLDQPENAAFLQVWERKPGEDAANWVFSGWMFSSNPSLSAMDHSVYDVWVIECKNASTSAKSETFSSETAPEAAPEETPKEGESSESAPAETPETAEEAPTIEAVEEEAPPSAEEIPAMEAPGATPAPAPKIEDMPSSFEDSAE